MERIMCVVKNRKTGKYLRVVTRVKNGKTVHDASWVDDITYANRTPGIKAAEIMFMCVAENLKEDTCEIVEVVVSVRER